MELSKSEFAPFYANYIEKAKNFNIPSDYESQMNYCIDFFKSIPLEKLDYQYENGKWTPKDILLHIIDCERIFACRALRIARNDKTPLPGFEENDYAIEANAFKRTLESLIDEYKTVRLASKSLFDTFDSDQFKAIGVASDKNISVRAIGYIILGHELHHIKIIEERYL